MSFPQTRVSAKRRSASGDDGTLSECDEIERCADLALPGTLVLFVVEENHDD